MFTRQYSGGLAAATPPAAKPAGGTRGRPAKRASGDCFTGSENIYIAKGARVFEKVPSYRLIKRNLYWTYSKKPLEGELKGVFQQRRIFDIEKPLSVQARDTEKGTVEFFNNFPETRRQHQDRNGFMWEIIRASTAAPAYFPPEANRYIDGGISSYNNPSYAAFIGATKYLKWPKGLEKLRIYSVGTGYQPPIVPKGTLAKKTKPSMGIYVIEALLHDINLLQNQIMKRLETDTRESWYRRYTIRLDKKSFDEAKIPSKGVDFQKISKLDGVKYVAELARIGEIVGRRLVRKEDFEN